MWGWILQGGLHNLEVTNLISHYKYQFSCTTLWFFFLHGIRETIYTVKRLAIFPSLAGMSLTFVLQCRERWLLLAVETEVNGDSGSTDERDPSLVGSLGLSCPYKRFLSYLGSSRPGSNILPHRTLFQFICPPLPSKLDRQPCWVTCLLVCVSA